MVGEASGQTWQTQICSEGEPRMSRWPSTPTTGRASLAFLWRLGTSNQSGLCSKLPSLKLWLEVVVIGWWPSNIVVDTGGQGNHLTEKESFWGMLPRGTPEALLRYRQARRMVASAVPEAKQQEWVEFGEATMKDFQLAPR